MINSPVRHGDNLSRTNIVMGNVVGWRLQHNIAGGSIATCTPSNPYCAMQ